MTLSDTELDAIADRLAPRLAALIGKPVSVVPEPIPQKLTVEEFAWCVQRSAYSINEDTRLNPKMKKHVQGKWPKLIHPAALALYGVDSALAAARLAQFPHKSAA